MAYPILSILLGMLAGCASYRGHGNAAEPHYLGEHQPGSKMHPFEGGEPGQFDPDARSLSR